LPPGLLDPPRLGTVLRNHVAEFGQDQVGAMPAQFLGSPLQSTPITSPKPPGSLQEKLSAGIPIFMRCKTTMNSILFKNRASYSMKPDASLFIKVLWSYYLLVSNCLIAEC
jgi:hypothetical protein